MLRRKNAKKLYHVSLEVGNKYRLTKKHTSLVSMQKSPFMKKVYKQVEVHTHACTTVRWRHVGLL